VGVVVSLCFIARSPHRGCMAAWPQPVATHICTAHTPPVMLCTAALHCMALHHTALVCCFCSLRHYIAPYYTTHLTPPSTSYMEPLRESGAVTEEEIAAIFSNITSLRDFHRVLWSELEPTYRAASEGEYFLSPFTPLLMASTDRTTVH
jgi:hypothetical protein